MFKQTKVIAGGLAGNATDIAWLDQIATGAFDFGPRDSCPAGLSPFAPAGD
jgi:hypothetical protein